MVLSETEICLGRKETQKLKRVCYFVFGHIGELFRFTHNWDVAARTQIRVIPVQPNINLQTNAKSKKATTMKKASQLNCSVVGCKEQPNSIRLCCYFDCLGRYKLCFWGQWSSNTAKAQWYVPNTSCWTVFPTQSCPTSDSQPDCTHKGSSIPTEHNWIWERTQLFI